MNSVEICAYIPSQEKKLYEKRKNKIVPQGTLSNGVNYELNSEQNKKEAFHMGSAARPVAAPFRREKYPYLRRYRDARQFDLNSSAPLLIAARHRYQHRGPAITAA